MDYPCFLDIEASGLGPHSYPVQIAWSDPEGGIECWLIDPSPVSWWDTWDWNAQDVHGIPRTMLTEFGKHPRWVAERMNEVLSGCTVYTDCQWADQFWVDVLFEAADLDRRFRVESVRDLFLELADHPNRIQVADALAWRRVPGRRHQADNDVRHLIEMWRLLTGDADGIHLGKIGNGTTDAGSGLR